LTRFSKVLALVVLCAVAIGSSGCGGSTSEAQPRTSASPAVVKLPSKLLGLTVGTEDVRSRLRSSEQPFVDSVGLFAFREGKDLLQATLQISRFTPEAKVDSPEFRGSIISRIGGANPRRVRVADENVYLTSGRNQVVFLWFRKHGFFVLTVRRDYPFPRTILRRLLDMHLSV
jgi:hypothetical protein